MQAYVQVQPSTHAVGKISARLLSAKAQLRHELRMFQCIRTVQN